MSRKETTTPDKQPVHVNTGVDLGFESQLFKAADKLRGNMEPGKYKPIVLGLKFVQEHGGRTGDIATTWRLCKMNLVMHGIDADIRWNSEGTLLRDEFPHLKFDYILANPPFNIPDWSGEPGAGKHTDVPGFCKSASIEEIRKHGYVLTPGRYVGAAQQDNDGEPFEEKMKRLMAQLREQQAEAARLDAAIWKNLEELGYGG